MIREAIGAAGAKSEMRDGWRIVAVGFVLLLLMFGTRLSFGVYIKPMAEDLETTRASISGSQSLYMLVYALFAFLAGSLSDRYGPKGVLAAGSFFMGVGNAPGEPDHGGVAVLSGLRRVRGRGERVSLRSGHRSVSAILGACTPAFGLAGLIAPWLAGYVFDLYKSY